MRKPHLIILGGTDCSSFPSIRYGNFQKKLLGWCTCMSLRWATHLLPVDETLIDTPYSYTLDDFPRQGFRNFCSKVTAKIETIHIGFDPDKFYRSAEKAGNTFLTVAQMNPANFYRKGIDLIFSIAPSFPHCTFTIVGNSPGMKYPSVPANVRMLPFVKYEDLIHLYSEHEFYLQLSIMEGFPSAPCEAMLCECIPVTSGVGALPSIVGETGFILRNKSQPELIRLVETALASDRQLLGRKARQQIMDHFPADTRMRLVQLIREIIDHGRALR